MQKLPYTLDIQDVGKTTRAYKDGKLVASTAFGLKSILEAIYAHENIPADKWVDYMDGEVVARDRIEDDK